MPPTVGVGHNNGASGLRVPSFLINVMLCYVILIYRRAYFPVLPHLRVQFTPILLCLPTTVLLTSVYIKQCPRP